MSDPRIEIEEDFFNDTIWVSVGGERLKNKDGTDRTFDDRHCAYTAGVTEVDRQKRAISAASQSSAGTHDAG